MYRKKTAFIFILLIAVILSACRDKQDSKDRFKIGIISNSNGKNDLYLNTVAMKGLTKFATEENLEKDKNYKYIETTSSKKFYKKLNKLADSNYDLIIGIGSDITEAMDKVSSKYKEVHFGIIDSQVNQPNVVSINFNEQEGSFLAGVIAAKKTKTKKIGFIGGDNNEVINRYKYGFIAGVKSINKEIEVLTKYSNTFNNPKTGSKIAKDFYNRNVDIIFPVAGISGSGVFNAAKIVGKTSQNKVWVIGVDRDQYKQGLPDNVTLFSLVKKMDIAVYDVAKQSKSNEFKGGKTLIYGINEDGMKLIKAKNNVDERIFDKVKEYKDKIRDGTLIVPSNKDEYLQFEKQKM